MFDENFYYGRKIRNSVAFFAAAILGFIGARLFYLGFIPIVLNFIIISLSLSMVVIFLYSGMYFVYNFFSNCKRFGKDFKSISKGLFFGVIGSFITSVIAMMLGVTSITLNTSIIIGITIFFFLIMLINLIYLISYFITMDN